jgi:hypothetical protein
LEVSHTPKPKVTQLLLGVLIIWQLVFILAANLFSITGSYFPARNNLENGRSTEIGAISARLIAHTVVTGINEVTSRWAQITGQFQGWSLYAPHVPTQAVFIVTAFRWADDREWRRDDPGMTRRISRSEKPENPEHYFRPFGTFRLQGYEANLALVMWTWDDSAVANDPEGWHERLAAHVRKNRKSIQAYLQWQLNSLVKEQPEKPAPKQVFLLARIYRIPNPKQWCGSWEQPIERPIALWRPFREPAEGKLSVESFNPVTGGFEPLGISE